MHNILYYPIINHFITKNNFNSYLELGLSDINNTYNHIVCTNKTSVDIDSKCNPTYVMSTDDFFSKLPCDKTWDLIFIDASHEKGQVLRDFNNSLNHLSTNGIIIMDDINPFTEELLQPQYCHNAWEVFAELRGTRNDLEMFGIESSFCGIVRRGHQQIHNLCPIQSNFKFLNDNRQELINIRSWEDICNE